MAATVASRNTYGQYFRARVSPTQSSSPYADGARALFASASAAWLALSDTQREQWRTSHQSRSGPLGLQTGLSGRALFIRQWIISSIASGAPVTVPIDTGPRDVSGLRVFSSGVNQLDVEWTSASPLPAGPWLKIDATAPLTAGSNYLPGRRAADGLSAYFTAIQVLTPGFTSPTSLTGVYNGRFGAGPSSGDRIGWRIRSAGSRWVELSRGIVTVL